MYVDGAETLCQLCVAFVFAASKWFRFYYYGYYR